MTTDVTARDGDDGLALTGQRLADRFVVQRRLGAGGMGVVYEAFDERRKELVALKTLGAMDGDSVYKLKKEFRSLADLVHENLVRLHELFFDRGRWFFTMARVEGMPFVAHVRSSADESVDALGRTTPAPVVPVHEPSLRRALSGLARGIVAIHGAGKIHRDLKPDNVLVTRDGHVTILDFGLVQAAANDIERSMELAGTPAYMAPEQLSTGGACPASDWYAVGIMLYEVLAGRLPWSGSTQEVLTAKLACLPAPALGDAIPEHLQDLADLAMALVRPRAEERPTEEAILMCLGGKPTAGDAAPPMSSRTPLFVGREAELAKLRSAYDAMKSGQTKTVWVEGVSGMGKSSFIEHFVDDLRWRATSSETVVLSGRCYERESVPFKALDAVIDALSRHLQRMDPIAAARLSPRDMPELCRLFPVLGRVGALTAAMPPRETTLDLQDLRRRAFRALKEILLRLADSAPLVLVIDDLQWGDADSGRFLNELLSPPDEPRLLLIGAYRSDEVGHSELLRVVRDHEKRTGTASEVIVLRPLAAAESQALARAILDEASAARASSIAEEGRGSPFFITELARAGRDREQDQPTTLAELVAKRIATLPNDAQRLLEILSVATGPLPREVALRAAGLAPAEDAVVPLLRAASLARTGTTTLETYHDRIRETVAQGLTKDVLVAHHAALADALARLPEPPAEALAHHYAVAGKRHEARTCSIQAAKRAFTALAFDRAARHYENALAQTDASEDRLDLEERLGDALASAGRGAAAAAAYLRVASRADELRSADLERRAAFELVASGELERGLALADKVAARVGIWIPKGARLQYLVGLLGILYLYLFGIPKRRRAESEVDRDVLRRIDVGHSLGIAMVTVDMMRAFALVGTSLIGALRTAEPRRVANALMHVCWTTGAFLRGPIEKWLAELRELSEELNDPKIRATEALVSGYFSYARGNWRLALQTLEEAEERGGRASGVAVELHYARSFKAYSLFYLGRFRECGDALLSLAREAEARGNRLAYALVASPIVWLRVDDVATAERNLDNAHRTLRGHTFQEYQHVLGRIFLLSYTGEPQTCLTMLDQYWPSLRRSGLLRADIVKTQFLYFRGFTRVAVARQTTNEDERRRLLSLAAKDTRALRRLPVIGVAGTADGIDAAIALVRGSTDDATANLRRAIERLTKDEMLGFAAAHRRHLGKLIGGSEGEEEVARADDFFRSQGIAKPDQFARMLAVGFPD